MKVRDSSDESSPPHLTSAPWPRRRGRPGRPSVAMSACCVCMELCTDKAVVRTPSAPTPSTEIPQILRTVGPPEGAPPRRLRPSFAPDLPLHLSHARHAAQALINCGHIYHLSCARRWFQTKGKSERGRPAHAPCPKCKEPYDMGSAVTVFMDVPKDERGEILFSPTPFPTRAGRGDVPDDADAVVLDSPRDGADRPGDTAGGDAATRREVASLRRDLRREQTRARRRTTAPRAPRWPPNAPTVSRRNAMRFKPSSLAENSARTTPSTRREPQRRRPRRLPTSCRRGSPSFSARRASWRTSRISGVWSGI